MRIKKRLKATSSMHLPLPTLHLIAQVHGNMHETSACQSWQDINLLGAIFFNIGHDIIKFYYYYYIRHKSQGFLTYGWLQVKGAIHLEKKTFGMQSSYLRHHRMIKSCIKDNDSSSCSDVVGHGGQPHHQHEQIFYSEQEKTRQLCKAQDI